ncbi:MAG: M3 family metallopeptidase [Opitutales bacterium]|nr:M3 family metallopeptidase [Opitutales bacterium]
MNHPFLDNRFEINWSALKPECVRPDIAEGMKLAQQKLDAIRELPRESASYQSVIAALEEATEELSGAWGRVNHLQEVCDSPELREAYNDVLPEVSVFFSRITLDEQLWLAVKAAAENSDSAKLSPIERRHLEETLKDFRENGAELPPEQKTRLEQIQSELSALTQKYSENVLDATNAFELIVDEPARLAGLPPHAREAARRDALKNGHGTEAEPKWRFTLQATSFGPLMQYLDDADIRRQIYEGFTNIGRQAPHDNTELVNKILALREEKAKLLGKANFADLTTSRRMAGSGRKALDFVEDMHGRIAAAFEREGLELEQFKAEQSGEAPSPLEPWETSYWMEKLRLSRYDFDEEELRPYFAIGKVISGLFGLVERLFGVRISERTGADKPEVWHEDVRFYDMFDKESGAQLGSFYTDWHPRSAKRSGAWMDGLKSGRGLPTGGHEPHLGLVCGNLTEPQGEKPALLTHREVETIFHEFGHLLHHLLGEVPVRSLNGTNVAWDFVEMPSQILENWTWERESLDLFARHIETGETIPQAILDKMLAARKFGAARMAMRQLSFGKMDLELHLNYEKWKGQDLDEAVRQIQNGYIPRTKTPMPNNVRNFNHLFSSATGYAAGYYSYKWAEVLDADAFTRFKKEGILNENVGRELREKILSKGNSEAPEKLFRDFMGRDPDADALLARQGLL